MRIPPPHKDSLLGVLRSPVYLRWQAGLQVFWLIALIQAPLAVKGFHWDWMGPTLASLPVYLVCYLAVYTAPVARLPYALLASHPLAGWPHCQRLGTVTAPVVSHP